MNDRGTGEIHVTMSEAEIGAELREPAATPGPVAEERIHDGADAGAIDHEGREFPAFSRAASWDGGSGIHENHLEEEEREGCRVIAGALEHESLQSDDAEGLAEYGPGDFVVQPGIAAERPQRVQSA